VVKPAGLLWEGSKALAQLAPGRQRPAVAPEEQSEGPQRAPAASAVAAPAASAVAAPAASAVAAPAASAVAAPVLELALAPLVNGLAQVGEAAPPKLHEATSEGGGRWGFAPALSR
jgi:hypothetical protein